MGIVSSNTSHILSFLPQDDIIEFWTLNKRIHQNAISTLVSRYQFPRHNYLLKRAFHQYLFANLSCTPTSLERTANLIWKYDVLSTDIQNNSKQSQTCAVNLIFKTDDDFSTSTFNHIENVIFEGVTYEHELVELTDKLPVLVDKQSFRHSQIKKCSSICVDFINYPYLKRLTMVESKNVVIKSVEKVEELKVIKSDYFPEAFMLRTVHLENMEINKQIEFNLVAQSKLLSLILIDVKFNSFILPSSITSLFLIANNETENIDGKLNFSSLKLRNLHLYSNKIDLKNLEGMGKLKTLKIKMTDTGRMQKVINFFAKSNKLPLLPVRTIYLNSSIATKLIEKPESFASVKNVIIESLEEKNEEILKALNKLGNLDTLKVWSLDLCDNLLQKLCTRKIKKLVLMYCIVDQTALFEFLERSRVETFLFNNHITYESVNKMQKKLPFLGRISKP